MAEGLERLLAVLQARACMSTGEVVAVDTDHDKPYRQQMGGAVVVPVLETTNQQTSATTSSPFQYLVHSPQHHMHSLPAASGQPRLPVRRRYRTQS